MLSDLVPVFEATISKCMVSNYCFPCVPALVGNCKLAIGLMSRVYPASWGRVYQAKRLQSPMKMDGQILKYTCRSAYIHPQLKHRVKIRLVLDDSDLQMRLYKSDKMNAHAHFCYTEGFFFFIWLLFGYPPKVHLSCTPKTTQKKLKGEKKNHSLPRYHKLYVILYLHSGKRTTGCFFPWSHNNENRAETLKYLACIGRFYHVRNNPPNIPRMQKWKVFA